MEDFGYKKDEGDNQFVLFSKKTFLIAATLFSIAGFIYVSVSAYYFVYQDKDSDIEIIHSPEFAIKVLEEEKIVDGSKSLQIDSSIYEDIFGNKAARKDENSEAKIRKILQPAMPPKQLDVDRRLIKENSQKIAEPEIAKPEIAKPEIARPQIIEEKSAEKKPNNQPQKIGVFSNEAKKEAPSQDFLTKDSGTEKAVAAKTSTPKVSEKKQKRAVRVQIAALASESAATESWQRLKKLYPNLFADLDKYVQAIDLGKRGTFYRLQVGNFYNQVEAEEFCNRYVAQTQKSRADCIVVE